MLLSEDENDADDDIFDRWRRAFNEADPVLIELLDHHLRHPGDDDNNDENDEDVNEDNDDHSDEILNQIEAQHY